MLQSLYWLTRLGFSKLPDQPSLPSEGQEHHCSHCYTHAGSLGPCLLAVLGTEVELFCISQLPHGTLLGSWVGGGLQGLEKVLRGPWYWHQRREGAKVIADRQQTESSVRPESAWAWVRHLSILNLGSTVFSMPSARSS